MNKMQSILSARFLGGNLSPSFLRQFSSSLSETTKASAVLVQGRAKTPTTTAAQLQITNRAIQRLAELNRESGKFEALRIGVISGGCHGFQYRFELQDANQLQSDDIVFDVEAHSSSPPSTDETNQQETSEGQKQTQRFLVDRVSYPYLAGSEIDHVEELIGSSFTVSTNPNAESECGCKVSFQVKS